MSEEPSPSTPRLVRIARILGYVAAALGTADLAWVALGHLAVPAPVYTAIMIFMAVAAVLVGIFAFLVQADHRRAKAQAEILGELRRLFARLVDVDQRLGEMDRAITLLRRWVEGSSGRTENWLGDISKGVMKMSGASEERMVVASAHWAAVQHQIGQLPGVVQEVVVEAFIPALEALAERELRAREEFMTEVHSITGDLTDRVDAFAADGYECVDPESNTRTFVPKETMDALRALGGVKLPPPRSSGS